MNNYKKIFFLYKYFRGLLQRERRNMNREIKFFLINDINNIIVGR
jgi:N-acetylglutamate synthase-like GNAT family acetyltransferase